MLQHLSPLRLLQQECTVLTNLQTQFVDGPLRGIINFTMMYTYLQVVGIMWAVLSNAAVTLSFLSFKFVESHFSSSSSPTSLLRHLQPYTLLQYLCTIYALFAPFRVFLKTSHAAFTSAWHSGSDFSSVASYLSPRVSSSKVQKLYVLAAVLLLPLVCAVLMLFSAVTCAPSCEHSPAHGGGYVCYASESPPPAICGSKILNVFSTWRPFQRHMIMTLLSQSTLHLMQAACFFFPFRKKTAGGWFETLRGSCAPGMQYLALASFNALGGVLFTLVSISSVYEGCRLFHLMPSSSPPLHPLLSLAALLPTSFFYVATLVTWLFLAAEPAPELQTPAALTEFFRRCKHCFLLSSLLCFLAQAFNPSIGFVHAQISLTLLTFVGPLVHVVTGVLVEGALALSIREKEVCSPPQYLAAVVVCVAYGVVGATMVTHFSAVSGPLTSIFVGLHLVGKLKNFVKNDKMDTRASATPSAPTSTSTTAALPSSPSSPELPRKSSDTATKHSAAMSGFVHLGRVGFYFTLFMSCAVAMISLTSYLQLQSGWYPDLISLQKDPDGLTLTHAYVCKLKLFTGSSSFSSPSSSSSSPSSSSSLSKPPRYASCGHKFSGLTLLDYALLSEAAYFDDDFAEINEVVSDLFGGDRSGKGPLFRVEVPDKKKRTEGGAQFFTATSDELNVHVVAVRGTDVGRLRDLLEDVSLFKEPVLLSLLSVFFPTIRVWPDSAAAYVVHIISISTSYFGVSETKKYYHSVLEHVTELKGDGKDIVLTGHSLGGGIARVVAAIEGLPSVGFSPPGVGMSYLKFLGPNLSPRSLQHMSVAVVPEHDIIPSIDAQVGLLQRVECSASSEAHLNSCHMLEGTIETLLNSCGDERGRFTGATFTFGMHDVVSQTMTMAMHELDDILAAVAIVVLVVIFIKFF